MKTRADLDDMLAGIYWNCEHGEHAKAIDKLMKLQVDAHADGVSEMRVVLKQIIEGKANE